MNKLFSLSRGHVLIEALLASALLSLVLGAVLGGFVSVRAGRINQKFKILAQGHLDYTLEGLRSIKEAQGGWDIINANPEGTYHVVLNGGSWTLVSGSEQVGDFTRLVKVSQVCRDKNTKQIAPCGLAGSFIDPSILELEAQVLWGSAENQKLSAKTYFTRYNQNTTHTETTKADFQQGQASGTNPDSNEGKVVLANNRNARWCSPNLLSATIDLPDGPPVAVVAKSNPTSNSVPNDVLVATSPSYDNSIKLVYLTVPANLAEGQNPNPTLKGIFTLDPSKYSNTSYYPTGINLDNNFKTNDLAYYTSSSGKLYALLATTKPDKEVVAVLVNDGNDQTNTEYQDPINKIYKYHTFFNTRIYQGNTSSMPNQDQSPYDYGAVSIKVYEDRGYILSGGFLYVFNLANIDSKSPANGLDMVGCRIELDGFDCKPPASSVKKYNPGQTGTSWSKTATPIHSDCSDGGNIELYADNDVDVVRVGSSLYAFVAVGGVTNPELNVVNVTSVPTSSTSPKINSSSCGTISLGNSGWKRISTLDFNGIYQTEEAANSVFVNSEGTRVYISSNGGIDANNDGNPDSFQFYIIDVSNKTNPKFISGFSSPPSSGYYYGQNAPYANKQLYPRRSLTVLNGARAVLVGRDGISDTNDAEEYQVIRMEGDGSSEANPKYCGGVDFDAGFNDLVSVVEADGDSFVYMVANTNEKQLKIIQGGEDGTYVPEGIFTSKAFDVGSGKTAMFNRVFADVDIPLGTSFSFKVATYGGPNDDCNLITPSFLGPLGTTDENDVYVSSGTVPYLDLSLPSRNPARCFKYQAKFVSDENRNLTPTLNSFTVNYSP